MSNLRFIELRNRLSIVVRLLYIGLYNTLAMFESFGYRFYRIDQYISHTYIIYICTIHIDITYLSSLEVSVLEVN